MNRVFLLLVVVFFAGCNETLEEKHPTLASAKRAGLIERGWIPPVLPESSHHIFERHNLDSNASILAFRHRGDLNAKLKEKCEERTVVNVKGSRLNASWWPNDLVADRFSVQTPRFIFYYCSDFKGFFAVATPDDEAYFWRNGV